MRPALVASCLVAVARGLVINDAMLGADSPERFEGCQGGCAKTFEWVQTEKLANFKSRPEKSAWEQRLKEIVQKGGERPCHPDIMAKSYDFRTGLGSRVNSWVSELALAFYGGFSFSLCRSNKDHFIDNVWEKHFDNVANFSSCRLLTGACRNGNGQVGAGLLSSLKAMDREYVDDLKHFLYPYVWKYNAQTQERVDEALRTVGLKTDEPYVGVHIRRGDKVMKGEAAKVDTEAYANAIMPSLLLGNVSQLYVASDDALAVPELKALLGSQVRIVRAPPSNFRDHRYESEEDIMGLLVDIEALRRASVFVGTASSNMGRLVYSLRPRQSKSISMDWSDFLARSQ